MCEIFDFELSCEGDSFDSDLDGSEENCTFQGSSKNPLAVSCYGEFTYMESGNSYRMDIQIDFSKCEMDITVEGIGSCQI